jgi:hypothetical protein
LDEPEDALVADLMFQEADHPFLGNFREERSNIGVQYETHFLAADPDVKCVQRIVLAAPGSKPIREPEEIRLVDLVQHRRHRSLDDLVFEGGDRERARLAKGSTRLCRVEWQDEGLGAVFLRNIAPSGRLRPIRA